MTLLLRPVSAEDLDSLGELDSRYARENDLEPVISAASLNFFGRSGHSFAAIEVGEAVGFLLGQAIWDGNRPLVLVQRLVATGVGVRRALLEALTKSAYDAGVYDVLVIVPTADGGAAPVLHSGGYSRRSAELFGRTLGSRGAAAGG